MLAVGGLPVFNVVVVKFYINWTYSNLIIQNNTDLPSSLTRTITIISVGTRRYTVKSKYNYINEEYLYVPQPNIIFNILYFLVP